MTPPNYTNIPAELTEKDHWGLWCQQNRSHRMTKVPSFAATGEMASDAHSGVGFVFTKGESRSSLRLLREQDPLEFYTPGAMAIEASDSEGNR
jgi:hypothetical protein